MGAKARIRPVWTAPVPSLRKGLVLARSLLSVLLQTARNPNPDNFMRKLTVAAAQLGPIQKAESREAVVKRMLVLLDEAKGKGADLVVYPELALTTFFPRWYMTDQKEVDTWFES